MSVLGPSTWTSAASTGSVGASTAATSTAAAAARPITHQPSSAVAPMASGMPISSSRQVDIHARQVAQERSCSGRSRASPTPISATSTQNSVRCSVSARWSTGEIVELPGSSPMPAPDDHQHDGRRQRHPAQGGRQHDAEQQARRHR